MSDTGATTTDCYRRPISIESNDSKTLSILHVFSTFSVGGPQIRFAAFVNGSRGSFRHLLFAVDGRYDCLDRIHQDADVEVLKSHPESGTTAGNVVAAAKALRHLDPDLLVTYNWGSIEWALGSSFTKIPYVHIVDGFGPEEVERQLARRVWFRRLALARCARIIVPSRTLYRLVNKVWRFSEQRLTYIPNGIDVERFEKPPDEALLADLRIPRDRPIVGTVATLRPEKNIGRLLRAFADVSRRLPATLVVVGDGSEQAMLEAQSEAMGLTGAVIFTGALEDPARILGAFDIFAVSSDTEQMPISVLEAMAAGLPIASVDVGDVRDMVADENTPFIVERNSDSLAEALFDMLSDAPLCAGIARANRIRAAEKFALHHMISSYKALFWTLAKSRAG